MVDSKIETVRALLTQAADRAATDAERDRFTERAMKIMAKYNISQAMIDCASATDHKILKKSFSLAGRYGKERLDLASAIACIFSCTGYSTRVGRKVTSLILFGHENDIKQFDLLWTSLNLQIIHGIERVRSRDSYECEGMSKSLSSYRRDWLYGFSVAVVNRLTDIHSEASWEYERESGTSTALALADRQGRAQRALDAEEVDLGKPAKLSPRRGEGVRVGYYAGTTADLGDRRQLDTVR